MVCYICSNNWYVTLCQEADLIRQGADQTKNDAGKVRDEAEALEGRVAVTANKIKELETLAAQDEDLTTVVSACALAQCSLEWRYWSDKVHTHCHIPGINIELTFFFNIFCWPCISIYLFLNINQLDALNFIISLFQASTCFEHMCSPSGGQKLYYTVSGIITPIGGRPVHRLREDLALRQMQSMYTDNNQRFITVLSGTLNLGWRCPHIFKYRL